MTRVFRVGLMWHGDRQARDDSDLDKSRFAKAADAIREVGLEPEPVVYNDDFVEEVRAQLLELDAVQVWVNPIENGRDRSKLDQLLREVSEEGLRVYTHPDTILKMGTKQILMDTADMSWGPDVAEYTSIDDMRDHLPERLAQGPRVLKQLRGHSGGGIWKVESDSPGGPVKLTSLVRLRHAQRGSVEETVPFSTVLERMEPYFAASGKMIEQTYQPRLPEGMTRVYMVGSQVAGFGHQEVNALFPAPPGSAPEDAPQPGPRLYYPPDETRFQTLGSKMQDEWTEELFERLRILRSQRPLLWDADFLLGPKDEKGDDTYVLCEINVSSVSPYPDSANPLIAKELKRRLNPPGFLSDCVSKDPSISEILLVPLDIAPVAKDARNRINQAVFPTDGAIVEVEGAELCELLSDEQVQGIIAALGAGIAFEDMPNMLSMDRLRYHTIVLVSDRTEVGRYLTKQLVTLFHTCLKPILDAGHVYIAMADEWAETDDQFDSRVLDPESRQLVRLPTGKSLAELLEFACAVES